MAGTDRLIVLTNGAWHGAWCWTDVIPQLVARGARVVALEFDGFGGLRGTSPAARTGRPFDPASFATERSGVADLTVPAIAASFNARVAGVARGASVTVVGHSLGGVVVAEAVEAQPELYSSVVYLSAVVPVGALSAGAYNAEPEQQGSLLPSLIAADPAIVGALRCDFDAPARRDDIVRAFGLEPIGARAGAVVSLLSSDAPGGADTSVRVDPARSGRIPHTYVRCDADQAVRPALQDRIVRELEHGLQAAVAVRSIPSGHSPFFTHPELVAEAILGG